MKRFRVLLYILKKTKASKMILGFFIFFLLAALIIMIAEPEINTYGSALWYCYSVFSTVGFGDEISVTFVGRIVSVVMTIATIYVVAVVTGVIVMFYNEMISIKYKASKAEFMDKLERLPELSKEELKELSEKIKVLSDKKDDK